MGQVVMGQLVWGGVDMGVEWNGACDARWLLYMDTGIICLGPGACSARSLGSYCTIIGRRN